ncbi:MAG TPA: HAMP domain-containing histidine kinase [Ignavibacteria bacterium]|nr:HAMP domain-containing histidine kinase [Ignavibacteria bacterium]
MKLTRVHSSSFEIQSFLFIEKLFAVMKSIFSKNAEIIISQYKHLIELSPEPIVILEEDKIIFVNKPAVILFGEENEKALINQSMIDFVEASYKNKARESLAKIILSGEDSIIADVQIKNLKSELRYIQGIATEIFFDNKKAILVMLRDISEMKEREKELKQIAEEAQKVEQLKSQFLAQMSHEIRSPLHAMMIAINLLEEELTVDENDTNSNYFMVIKSASRRIIKTVDLILNSAELTSNLYKPIFKEVDIRTILSQLAAEYKNTAGGKGIELRLKTLTKHSKTIGDEYSLTQIFSNLIDNAIKFTMEGKIDLVLRRDSEFNLIVEIIDTGVGISRDYLPKIFAEFTQQENGYNRGYEGTGLGMAVVKKFCDLNDIDICIESSVGTGTIVSLTFLTDRKER